MKFPAGAPTDVRDEKLEAGEKLRGQLVHGACRESCALPHDALRTLKYELYLLKLKFFTATLESYFTHYLDLFSLNAFF